MQNKSINILKVIAMLSVFCLHTSIYSSAGGFVFSANTWFLQTPAWAAVWIFFIISGYLNGKGFLFGRYKEHSKWKLSKIMIFYYKRFIKVYIPYIVFGIFVVILIDPNYLEVNPKFIVQLLTATFTNIPGSITIGVLWYVSTLLWLYMFTPLIGFVLDIINRKYNNLKIIIEILLLMLIGLIWRWWMYNNGADWSTQIYVPFYANLDIYICGILFNLLDVEKLKSKKFSYISSVLLFALIIFNIRISYIGTYYNSFWIDFYCLTLPTIYIAVIGAFLLGHNTMHQWHNKIIGNILDFYANISFEFYMSHCVILNAIYLKYIHATTGNMYHLQLLVMAFALTTIFAYFLHKAFSMKLNPETILAKRKYLEKY